MSRFDSMSRLRPGALAALYVQEAPHVLLLSVAVYITATLPPSWLGRWPLLLFSVLVAVRLLGPMYRWFSCRYQLSPTHLTERAGVLRIRTRSLAWADVTAVEVHIPWSHRASGLAILTVRTDGGPDTTVRLDGVDRQDAETIRLRSRGIESRGTEQGPGAEKASPPDGPTEKETPTPVAVSAVLETRPFRPVYRAGPVDLLAASLFYGQFILLAGAFIGVLVQFAELFHAAPVVLAVVEDRPVTSLAVLAIIGSAVGCVLTAVKFHGFSVFQDPQSVMLRHGLFTTQQRIVRRADIIGIRLRRNLVEMLFDRVRVSLISTDSSQQLGTNLMLPSLSRRRVAQILAPLFPQHQDTLRLRGGGRRGMPSVAIVTLLPLGAAIGVLLAVRRWTEWAWFFELVLAAVTLLLVSAAAHLAAARCDFSRLDHGEILWSSLLGGQTKYILNLDAVHAATTVALSRSDPGSHQIFRLYFYAGTSRTLTAVVAEDHGFRAVEQAAGRYGEEIAASRKRKKAAS